MTPKKYVSDVIKEGKRIRWPKRDVLIPTIIVVILIAGIAALFLSLEDLAAGRLIQLLKDAFGGN
ncbi:MAG: preprotein translocase subunit SecE [Bacilli bacterium]|nr:preprotein translocase subunit SecE [Bacilli bacterium]